MKMQTSRAIKVVALCLGLSACAATAQSTFVVPSQFATAKTAFVAFAGGEVFGVSNEQALGLLQNALVSEHRYTLARTPAEAELSIRVSLEVAGIKLAVFDTHTGMLLWTLSSAFTAGLEKNQPKKLAKAVNELTAQPEELASGKVPETSTPIR